MNASILSAQVLLRSDKGVSNFSDRSLLKNLGHWLGLMTLAKNKPILQLVSIFLPWSYLAFNIRRKFLWSYPTLSIKKTAVK